MRIRTGHKPTDWTENVPEAPHRSPGSYTVPAENVGSMRPILTNGSYLMTDKRRSQNAEAKRRWRERNP